MRGDGGRLGGRPFLMFVSCLSLLPAVVWYSGLLMSSRPSSEETERKFHQVWEVGQRADCNTSCQTLSFSFSYCVHHFGSLHV